MYRKCQNNELLSYMTKEKENYELECQKPIRIEISDIFYRVLTKANRKQELK